MDNPLTFNEKLQWLKLYDRNPLYTVMVDKYAVKNYVKSIIGEEYIIPAYGCWNSFDEINFDKLPDQFVLKCTHDSGGLVICKDKKSFDVEKAKKKLEFSLKRDFWLIGREWPYKDVPKKILAEKYMEDKKTHELRDYKFMTFGGKVKCCFIAKDRQSNQPTTFDFYDENFSHLNIVNGHPNSAENIEKPLNFGMIF